MTRLVNKFKSINVQIKISDDANTGKVTSEPEAKRAIADSLLANNPDSTNITSIYEEYNGNLLYVEKYGEDRNIGKAKDKFSGLLRAETAPSYFATSDQLIGELKIILDSI